MDLCVAVVARPGAPGLAACLRALGTEARVETVGADGPGMARNRALAACAGDVLALVEDDVVVAPGWLAAVHAAWARAADDVAVVGGPLAGVAGLGEAPADVDLARRSFHGANVSFRTDALRGAGGFWPARGDVRDWFSDEHHAQHALARAGWRGRYEPAMAARREGVPTARQRFRTGARLAQAGGGRPAGVAVRALATGLAGAVVGNRAERLGRAAENLGVLVGGRAARRDFEPTVPSTPLRPSVPGPPRRRRGPARHGATILLYHRVADEPDDGLGLRVSTASFAAQVELLARTRRVLALADIRAHARDPRAVAVTFDDGYADNLAAADVLEAAGLPWTLFVSTGHVEARRPFFWDEVARAFAAAAPAPLRLDMPGGARAWRATTPEARTTLLAALQALDPAAIERALDAVRAWAGIEPEPRAMTVGELRALATRAGVTIGAHTRTHRGLAYAPAADQRAEVRASADDLERWLGRRPDQFSYPFGVPGADVSVVSRDAVAAEGFRLAVVNRPGAVAGADPLALPRRAVPDADGGTFGRWLKT